MASGEGSGVARPMRITYLLDYGGEQEERELPFVIGVIGEFAGSLAQPGVPVEERSFVDVTVEHLLESDAKGSLGGLAALHASIAGRPRARLRALHMTRLELTMTLGRAVRIDETPLFRQVYVQEYGTVAGVPYGALLVDFEFDHRAADVAALERLAEIGSFACCLVATSCAPTAFGIAEWGELREVELRESMSCSAAYREWHALRDRDVTRFLALTAPVQNGGEPRDTIAGVYTLGELILRNHLESGCPADLASTAASVPAEYQAAVDVIERLGAVPVLPADSARPARLGTARCFQRARRYHDESRVQLAEASILLAHSMTMALFARNLAMIGRGKIGSFMDVKDCTAWLNRVVDPFVSQNLEGDEPRRTRAALGAAVVDIDEVAGSPSAFQIKFDAQPLIPGVDVPGTTRVCCQAIML